MTHLNHTCPWPVSRAARLTLALLTLCIAACAPRDDHRGSETTDTAETAATVTGVDVADVKALMGEAKGRVAVVNLWATWCGPCVMEMPELAAFYREHPREKVAFFAISLDDPKEMDGAVTRFMTEKKLPFPAYVLTERDIDAISQALRQDIYGVLPTTIVYDRNGAVKKMWEGAITREELNAVVKPLL